MARKKLTPEERQAREQERQEQEKQNLELLQNIFTNGSKEEKQKLLAIIVEHKKNEMKAEKKKEVLGKKMEYEKANAEYRKIYGEDAFENEAEQTE